MAIKLILLLTSLLSPDLALAQAGVGGGRIPVTIPAFALTIGDSVFTGAEPPLEHTQGQISFTLNVDIFSDPTNVPQTVMVCTPIGQGCAVLSNFGPHAVLKGVVNVNFPSVGATVQMTVCEDVKRGVNICGKTLCTAQKPVSLSASYAFLVTNVTVFHTRAHTTDTAYVSTMGGSLVSTLSKANCDGINPALPSLCQTVSVGSFQDGDHEVKPPIVMSSCNLTNAVTSGCKFALAVWDFGFELVSNSGDLADALFSAAMPLLTNDSSSPGEVDITHALNDRAWEGCDGPTLGKVFTMTGEQLDQLTRATGNSSQSVERSKVRSQVGCGASSDYSATFSIVRESWEPPAD